MPNTIMKNFSMKGSGSKEAFKMIVLCGLVNGEYIFRIIYNIKKAFGIGSTYVASNTLFLLKFC